MSSSLDTQTEWNHRKPEQRLIIIKGKNEEARRISVLDVLTNLSFVANVSTSLSLDNLKQETEYMATLEIYTSKKLDNIAPDFLPFFEALDIDQQVDDFIKAYWVYPTKIRFDLESVEEA